MDDAFRAAADLLEERSRRRLPFTPDFRPLPAADVPRRTVAVDGSEAVLADNGSVWVVAVRAAAVTWPGPPVLAPPPEVHATVPADASDQVAAAYAVWGIEAPRVTSAESYAEALRELAELAATRSALADLGPEDLLLVDGALERLGRAGSSAEQRMQRILEAAAARGVPVIGVAKRSRLERDGVPLVPTLHRTGPDGTWSVRDPDYETVHIARLHPAAPHSFRVDATDAAALGRLLPLSKDAVYLGYPYPLAVAHNTVALTAGHVRDLRLRLADAVRVRGGEAAAELLRDFHEVLDRNVPA